MQQNFTEIVPGEPLHGSIKRKRGSIYVYKTLFGMIETDVSALFIVYNADTVTCGHNFKLFMQQSRIDVCKYFFSNRVTRVGVVHQPCQATSRLYDVSEKCYRELI